LSRQEVVTRHPSRFTQVRPPVLRYCKRIRRLRGARG